MTWKSLLSGKVSKELHKYDYGHLVVYAGPQMTGAACLAGISALRMGVGLVTITAHPQTANVFRSFCPSFIVEELDETAHFSQHFGDPRQNAILIGCGAGQTNNAGLQHAVLDSVQSGKIAILDGDGLTVFEDNREKLLPQLHAKCVLTPHEGEFKKLFPALTGSKREKAVSAAMQSGAIIVLKGAETIVAAPDATSEILTNGSPWLATAGSGDVLAGMIAGFAAWHENDLFNAVCAAVHMHGEASKLAGAGMISADLPNYISKCYGD